MTDNTEQFDKGTSSGFSDGAIRRFLLGQLSAAERLPFEERLFDDDSLETRVRLAEYELADDYAFDRLPLAERKLFEQKFLLSIDREKKLRVSKALCNRFASVSAAVPFEEKTTVSRRVGVLLSFTQQARRFSFAVVILLLLIGTVLLVRREPRITQKFFARRPPVAKPMPTPFTTPQETHHASSTPTQHETSSPIAPHEPSMPKIDSPAKSEPAISIVLFPTTSSETVKSTFINLPNDEHDIVRLALSIKPNQPGTYRAELLTSNGQSVFSAESLKAPDSDGSKTYLDVSAGLLKTGDYQIKLRRVSEESGEQVETYYFRVQ